MTLRPARAALLVLVLGAGAAQESGGTPDTGARLQQLQRQLQEQRQLSAQKAQELQTLRARIQNLTAQQRQTLAQLDALAQRTATLENELATVTARVALAERQLADTGEQLKVTRARVTRLQGDVREVMQLMYRQRSGQYLELLSQARSLSDLLIRLRYANMAGAYQTEVLAGLRGQVAALREQEGAQRAQAAQLKALQAQRGSKLRALQAQRTQQNTLLAQLRASEQGQRTLATRKAAEQALAAQQVDQLVGQVVAERARLEAERQRRLEEERRRREEEARRIREAQERARQEALRLARLREAQAAAAARQAQQARAAQLRQAQQARAAQLQRDQQARAAQLEREQQALRDRQVQVQAAQVQVEQQLAPLPAVTGPVGFPLPGGRVAAPFGANGTPWVVLTGADRAVAAAEGNVLAVSYYASLGWVVLIDHGSSVSAYLGLRDPLVSVGSRVGRGTPVGAVGGSSIIGPGNMAFQLRQGGQPVAPGF
ncbi:murein hydrolase activator EnvC family protein [Deinococcus actinosclerus]|uniref:Peptidase M23 n=1 Tax=Deinococcus actinosclerus TaxID=1768108 RepID=A0ABN4K4G4_9DEIO|nr:M23 family metallopeptidase [Deinococcus actinosclerus]ALW88950.1 peptidase M23 [Deinococcus actinosclerus]